MDEGPVQGFDALGLRCGDDPHPFPVLCQLGRPADPRDRITPDVCDAHPLDPGSLVPACEVPSSTKRGAKRRCNAGEQ